VSHISIEPSIFHDRRFLTLSKKLGSIELAMGWLITLWRMAKEYYRANGGLGVPVDAWNREGVPMDVIDCGLAGFSPCGDFILVAGAKKRFDLSVKRAAAGRAGGIRSGISRSKIIDEKPKQRSKMKQTKQELPLTGPVWDAYSEAYHARYGQKPIRNARVNGQISQLLKRIPAADAPAIAAFYVKHNAWAYVNAVHPIGMLLRDAERIATECALGRAVVTSASAREIDRTTHNANMADEIIREMREEKKWKESQSH